MFFRNNADKYKQRIGQSIRESFSAHVLATCINTGFKTINGEQVYVVHILTYYKDFKFDDKYYIHGVYGRIPLTENEFLEYNENRKTKLNLSTFTGVEVDQDERPEEANTAALITPKEEEKTTATPLEYSTDYSAIKTSKIRLAKMKNDGISEYDLTRYISLQEDNTYMLSPSPAGGSLSLGIRDEEHEGVLVVVTENGEVRRIDMQNLLSGSEDWQPVDINDKSKIVFMSPTTIDFNLVIVYRHKNTVYLRMETVESLKDSTFNKSGRKFYSGQIDEVILCELIDNDAASKLKTIQGFSNDRLGVDYAKTEGKKTRRLIEGLGADVSGI